MMRRALVRALTPLAALGSPALTQLPPASAPQFNELLRCLSSSIAASFSSPSEPLAGMPEALASPHAQLIVGQPSHHTHPELLSAGELTPGIQAKEYQQRRQRLMSALPPGSLVVLPSASITYMSGVIPYPYRQDPDFFFLSGLSQRGVIVLQSSTTTPGQFTFTLFIEAPNAERERWDGATVERDAALQVFGADQVFTLGQLPKVLKSMALNATQVFFDLDRTSSHHHSSINVILQTALAASNAATSASQQATSSSGGVQGAGTGTGTGAGTVVWEAPEAPRRLQGLRQLLHAMRLRKSPAEAALMRASASVAADGLLTCMQHSQPGVHEFTLAATFEFECKRRGASRMAFPQVVAGGVDATTIHYGRNDKVLHSGQMVLMDAGCELHGYCSDVTRTWPINGRFTPAQRAVYDLVLSVHTSCVQACRPGSSLRELHSLSCRLLSEGLVDLGVLRGVSVSEVEGGLYRQFFWHSLGHWLGLDTHDTHLMGHDRLLQAGHVITIEPGLYIPNEAQFGALRGIGVRIEDDVLVTQNGCEVLSVGVPHLPEQIQAVVGAGLR